MIGSRKIKIRFTTAEFIAALRRAEADDERWPWLRSADWLLERAPAGRDRQGSERMRPRLAGGTTMDATMPGDGVLQVSLSIFATCGFDSIEDHAAITARTAVLMQAAVKKAIEKNRYAPNGELARAFGKIIFGENKAFIARVLTRDCAALDDRMIYWLGD